MVQHVAPMAEHVHDDAAAVLLAVVPRGSLRRLLVAFEDPVAELAAHRKNAAEETAVDQALEFAHAGEKELVLHDAVLHAGALAWRASCNAVADRRQAASRSTRACRRAIARARWRRAMRSLRVEVNAVIGVGECAASRWSSGPRHGRGDLLQLGGVAADENRIGQRREPSASGLRPDCESRGWSGPGAGSVPMRPVTPFMMMPIRLSFMSRLASILLLCVDSSLHSLLDRVVCFLAQKTAIVRLRSEPEDHDHHNGHGRLEHSQCPGISKAIAQHEFYCRRRCGQQHSELIHNSREEASHRVW